MVPRELLAPALLLLLSALLLAPPIAHAQHEEPDPITTWGTLGTGPGEWVDPLRMAVTDRWGGPGDAILVVDRASSRVQRYSTEGTLISEIQSSATPMRDPVAVTWTPEFGFSNTPEEIIVLDAELDAVLFFDVDGNYLRQFPVTAFEDGDIDVDLFEDRFHLVLSDRHVMETYTLDGTFLGRNGTLDAAGSGVDGFDTPRNLAVLYEAGWIAVSDTGNDRIKLYFGFGPSATPIVFGSSGSGDGQLSAPLGLGFDCRGDLVVADSGNDRVQRWTQIWGSPQFVANWFAPPGGGLSRVADVSYQLDQGIVAGKDETESEKRAFSGDLFVLDAGAGLMRRYEGTCCSGGFPTCDLCTATTAGGDLLISPAGNGPTLDSVGATVEVTIVDNCGLAIAGYPFQDIWLDDIGNGDISQCVGGSVADANTNANGQTTIGGVIAGGGSTEEGLHVYLAGMPLFLPPLPIRVVSPDINGDLRVDLADIGEFALDYFAPQYVFRSDMNFDGVLNLADIGTFALYLGDECP